MLLHKLEYIKEEVKQLFVEDAGGHDYFHTERVYQNAMNIAEYETCDKQIVALGALLHDVDDPKLFATENYTNARKIMCDAQIDVEVIEAVIEVIRTVFYKGTGTVIPKSIEGKIVQDADRLDAIGAIGIARAFAYGGSRGRELYNPDILPILDMNEKTYRNATGTTINHFYEKLLLLKDLMNTDTAKKIAYDRHNVMINFLEEFMDEWQGKR